MGLKDKVQQGDVTSASWANVTMADGILEALFGLEFGHADFADDADFLLCCLLVPQISQNSADFCPMRAGISQMLQMTQIFFAAHLSPITIERFCGILLVRSKFFGMTF